MKIISAFFRRTKVRDYLRNTKPFSKGFFNNFKQQSYPYGMEYPPYSKLFTGKMRKMNNYYVSVKKIQKLRDSCNLYNTFLP